MLIDCGARRVRVDEVYDPPGSRLRPGAAGVWPQVAGRDGGEVDLRLPLEGGSAFAYPLDFDEGWASLRRRDGKLGIRLSWDATVFPVAWLWEELGGSRGWPWFGRGRVVGLEPCTSWPGHGVADVAWRTGTQLRLAPGASVETALRLDVSGDPERAGYHACGPWMRGSSRRVQPRGRALGGGCGLSTARPYGLAKHRRVR